jgi:hypothetical protein
MRPADREDFLAPFNVLLAAFELTTDYRVKNQKELGHGQHIA